MDQKFDALENDVSFRLTKTLGSVVGLGGMYQCVGCACLWKLACFFSWNHAAWKKTVTPIEKDSILLYPQKHKTTRPCGFFPAIFPKDPDMSQIFFSLRDRDK